MAKSLGRGLSSLIPDQSKYKIETNLPVSPPAWLKNTKQEILEVSPQDIAANPYQPRQHFNEASLQDLMNSIKEHGILQPLVVTKKKDGKYELVAGERRLRAAQQLRLKHVSVIVRSAGELEKLELSLIENIQRQDLNPIERAEAYKKLVDEFSLTHEQAAKRMGKSRPVISNAMRLLDLPGEVQKMIAETRLSESAAIPLLELDNAEKQLTLAKQIATEKLTKDEARRLVKRNRTKIKSLKKSSDPLISGYARELESQLQTKVVLGRRGKNGWQISIDAYSLEELKEIINRILHT